MILIFDGETSSKSMLLLMRRHLVFRFLFFTIKIGFFFFFSASYVVVFL